MDFTRLGKNWVDVLTRGDLLLTRMFFPELPSPLKDQSVASAGDRQGSASARETEFGGNSLEKKNALPRGM